MAYLFSVLASLLWGTADFIGGLQAKRLPVPLLMVLSQLAGVPVLIAVMLGFGQRLPSGLAFWAGLACGICTLIGIGLLYYVMSAGAMLLIAPIAAGAAVVPVAVGIAQGEHVSALQAVGMVVALVGATLAALVPDKGGSSTHRISVWLGVLGAIAGTGCYLIVMRYAGHQEPLGAAVLAKLGAAVSAALVLVVVWRRLGRDQKPKRFSKGVWVIVAMGVFDALGAASYATATHHGAAGLVAVVSSMYPAVTVLLVMIFLKERGRWYQMLGIALAVTGILLLA